MKPCGSILTVFIDCLYKYSLAYWYLKCFYLICTVTTKLNSYNFVLVYSLNKNLLSLLNILWFCQWIDVTDRNWEICIQIINNSSNNHSKIYFNLVLNRDIHFLENSLWRELLHAQKPIAHYRKRKMPKSIIGPL